MKSITYGEGSIAGKLLCSLFGHRFVVTRVVTDHFREFECRICRMQVTNDIDGAKVSLTSEHREINKALMDLHRRRHLHM